MPTLDEEALIEAVLRVRQAGAATAAVAEVHTSLVDEGYEVTLSQVKKACSKATKRAGGLTATAPAAAPPLNLPSAKQLAKQEKAAAAKMKADASALKSAENEMMETQRRLRAARDGSEDGAVTITGTAEDFVQKATMMALAGKLEPGDERVLRERIEADLAALEFVKLASASGALSLTEDVVALGLELQLSRLKEVRGVKDYKAARACYVDGGREHETVDQAVKRTEALEALHADGPDTMEEMD